MLMMILNDAPRRSLSKIYAAGGISIEKRCEDFIFEFPEALQERPANHTEKKPIRFQGTRNEESEVLTPMYVYTYVICIYIYISICSSNTSGKEGISFFFESMEFEVKFKSLAAIIQFPQNYGGKANPPSGLSSLVDQVSLCYTLVFLLKIIFCTSFFFNIGAIKNQEYHVPKLCFIICRTFLGDVFHVTSFGFYISLISWKLNAPEGLPLGVSPLRHPIADEVEECRAGRASEGP